MIKAYGNAYNGVINRSPDVEGQFDPIRTFLETVQDVYDDPKNAVLKYGTNDAIELVRIANLVLADLWFQHCGETGSICGQYFWDELQKIFTKPQLNLQTLRLRDDLVNGFHPDLSNQKNSISLLKAAVAVQDSLNYNEPPDWYFTVRESLGFAYLANSLAERDTAIAADLAKSAAAFFQEDLLNNRASDRSLWGRICGLEIEQSLPFSASWKYVPPIPNPLYAQFDQAWRNANISANMNNSVSQAPAVPGAQAPTNSFASCRVSPGD